MNMNNSLHKDRGLSLVELMVALAVGLFLMAGVLQIYLGSRQSFRVQESLSRLQENGTFALMFLEQDLRMADYRGCGTRSARVPLNNILIPSGDYLWDFVTGIEGFEAVSTSDWDRSPDNNAIPTPLGGSDIVTVRRATGETFKVVSHASGTDDVEINSGSTIEAGDVVMVATCKSAAVFQVTNSSASGILEHDSGSDGDADTPDNSTSDLGTGYANGDLFLIDTVTYYIRNGNNNRPALFRKVGNDNAQELIQDVEDMQITYGEDTNMDALVDRYVSADGVANWSNVISVNVNLLLTTPEDNLTPDGEPQPYVFNGVNYDGVSGPLPEDNRLRHSFSSTITLRNRTL